MDTASSEFISHNVINNESLQGRFEKVHGVLTKRK